MPRFFPCLVLAVALAPPALLRADDHPGYSGMVRIADNSYLVVNDRKNSSAHRLAVLTLTPRDGVAYFPLAVDDWKHESKDPSDLEGCCAVPGREGEFLLTESGRYRKKFGRAFHVRVDHDKEGGWQAKCLGVFDTPQREPDDDGSTCEGDQFEGLACFAVGDKTVVVFGERGGAVKGGQKVGRLVWGELDLAKYRFEKLGEDDLVGKSVLGGRDCSDLHLEAKDGGFAVWSVATLDEGDAGPFRSAVFRAGRFVIDGEKKVRFEREEKPADMYELDGLKVEALAAPPKGMKKAAFAVGTDDEVFGGIWRTLYRKGE